MNCCKVGYSGCQKSRYANQSLTKPHRSRKNAVISRFNPPHPMDGPTNVQLCFNIFVIRS